MPKFPHNWISSHGKNISTFIKAFCVCAVIFTAVAAVVTFAGAPRREHTASSAVVPVRSIVSSSSTPEHIGGEGFSILIAVHNNVDHTPAEFMLCRFVPSYSKFYFMPVPLNFPVTTTQTVTDVYSGGNISAVRDALDTYFSINTAYYCDIGSTGFFKIFDRMGGLYYTVPQNINLQMPDGSGQLALAAKAGDQYLDGRKLYGLIAFSGYGGGDTQRCTVQSNIMKTFATKKLGGIFLTAPQDLSDVFQLVNTNAAMNDFLTNMDAVKKVTSARAFATPVPPPVPDEPPAKTSAYFK